MFGLIADLIASVISILLPCYLSYKSLRTGDPAQTTPWLIYFIMLSLALLAESWTLFVIGWMPFYSWFRLIFLLYLVLPQTQGAKLLYLQYFEPFILDHERQIDEFIGDTHHRLEQMGLGYMNIVVEWVRDKILGQASPQQQAVFNAATGGRSSAQQGGGTGSYAGYASDLLSRFAMPAARTSAAPAVGGTAGGSVLNMLSGVAGAALGAATSTGGTGTSSRSTPATASVEAASIPDTFIPAGLANPNMSERDRSNFISTQRDRLTAMLKALDREQQSLDLAYGSGPTTSTTTKQRPSSHGSGLGSKSRSEMSFDNIEYDDVHSNYSSNGNGSGGYPSQHSTPPKDRDRDRDYEHRQHHYRDRDHERDRRSHGGERGEGRRTTSGNWVPAGLGGWLGGGNSGGAGGDDSDRDTDYDRDRGGSRRSGGGSGENRGWTTARDITESIVRNAARDRE